MTPGQVAVFMEERKWDYRGESPLFLLASDLANTLLQPLGLPQLSLRVYPLLGCSLQSRTALEQRCGRMVRMVCVLGLAWNTYYMLYGRFGEATTLRCIETQDVNLRSASLALDF